MRIVLRLSFICLLLAAAFWTWLWGPVGLVLSTPLTVVLVVLGKYVPQLDFFEVLLGDEPALHTYVTYYQRLVARDQDEASELVEDFVETHTLDAVYEQVLLPALGGSSAVWLTCFVRAIRVSLTIAESRPILRRL